jgi:hypothetical protein
MGNANEYQKLLEPLAKMRRLAKEGGQMWFCDQCNKLGHSKECCQWSLDNPNNKFKNKEVVVTGISAQSGGGIGNKSGNKGGHGKTNKSSSIIYYFI